MVAMSTSAIYIFKQLIVEANHVALLNRSIEKLVCAMVTQLHVPLVQTVMQKSCV